MATLGSIGLIAGGVLVLVAAVAATVPPFPYRRLVAGLVQLWLGPLLIWFSSLDCWPGCTTVQDLGSWVALLFPVVAVLLLVVLALRDLRIGRPSRALSQGVEGRSSQE